jgi:Holliday junction resolvase RusA-like endonuclease
MIRFKVTGRPAPQGSKRHIGHGRMIEQSKAVGPWREAVRAETQRQIYERLAEWPDELAVSASLTFWLPRPQSHYRTGRNAHLLRESAPARPAGRPDVDKLARAVLDGLTAGGAFADDSQVVDLAVSKQWCGPGESPGVWIEIEGAK